MPLMAVIVFTLTLIFASFGPSFVSLSKSRFYLPRLLLCAAIVPMLVTYRPRSGLVIVFDAPLPGPWRGSCSNESSCQVVFDGSISGEVRTYHA